MLYGENKEIHEIILETNDVEIDQVISGRSQDRNESFTQEIGAISANESRLEPEFLTAADAIKLQAADEDLDIRPYLFDGNSRKHLLLDSGSQVCAWPPDPGDTVDPGMRLKAVNGSKLRCYGFKEVNIRINRKTYPIRAIKTDVVTPILGWNFTRKHRLHTGWTEWGDMVLTDPKAKINQILKFRSIKGETHKVSVIQQTVPSKSSHQLEFEVAAMKALDKNAEHKVLINDINKMPEGDFKELVKKCPEMV